MISIFHRSEDAFQHTALEFGVRLGIAENFLLRSVDSIAANRYVAGQHVTVDAAYIALPSSASTNSVRL